MSIKGKAWVFGENINTDQIFPKRYFKPVYDSGEMASHLMEGADEKWKRSVPETLSLVEITLVADLAVKKRRD